MKNNKIQNNKKISWKEYVYNSPYLIAIIVTSIAVMVCSDEIGIGAIAREAKVFVYEVHAKMPEKEAEVLAAAGSAQDGAENADMDPLNEGQMQPEAMDELSASEEENAGKCKDENDDLLNDSETDANVLKLENVENTEEMSKGVTNFEFYDPIQIDSPYYKDAGKIALTTEYSYVKENISYFNDAAFLGDSRTLGISDYAGLDEADFYCDSGMTIFKLLDEGVTYQKTGDKVDLTEVLQKKQYGKIYIMLGMNELGYGDTEFYLDRYRQVLQKIREWQPDAIIYIMANLHISREKNNSETEFNNININDKNAASASLADGMSVFYLDANPLFTDEDGFLSAELTFDGVHLYAKHYDVWREFLLEHAVEHRR